VKLMSGFASVLTVKDDSALALLARNGDENALHVLLIRYEPFIRTYSGFAGRAGVEADDLMQEGRLGLVSAVRRYNSEAGASFKTFAYLCIKRQIVSAVRRAVSGKNIPLNSYVSFDEMAKDEIACSDSLNPEDMVILRERISAVKAALAGMFTPFERRIFSLHLSGCSYKSIGKTMHISSKQVDNSLQRIKRKLSLLFG
jgi:RNA polymerase sporulation-specific sigma factor